MNTEPKPKKKKKKHKLPVLLLGIIAFLLAAYPYISNKSFEMATDSTISTVQKEMEDNAEKYAAEIEAAREYNSRLSGYRVKLSDFSGKGTEDDGTGLDYDDLLDMTSDGAMGYITIPAIDVNLLVYHGQSEEVLKKGIGHIKGTSLPVGGESTHTVLTGHTGLSSAKLFTDLNKLEEGDIFVLNIAGEHFAYEVDQIKIVDPNDTSDLAIVDGKDYCTLVTCYPYGINSHRLLVRGERTEYVEEDVEEAQSTKSASSQWMSEYTKALLISAGLFILGLLFIFITRKIKDKKRKRKALKEEQKHRLYNEERKNGKDNDDP